MEGGIWRPVRLHKLAGLVQSTGTAGYWGGKFKFVLGSPGWIGGGGLGIG
jgi:hypothetical protein